MNTTEKCKLCLKTCELKNSHIIPHLAIKPIRDESLNNRFYEFFNNQSKIIQDGPKEHLLCDQCEQYLGQRFEKYFKETIYLNRHGTQKTYYEKVLIIENLDYQKIKIFFLSLLWRASISSKPEFDNIYISDNEEIIRKMIIEGIPEKSSFFSISAIGLLMNNKHHMEWVTTFMPSNSEKYKTIYGIVLGGIFYMISTDCLTSPFPEEMILNESGCWNIPLKEISEIEVLFDFIKFNFNK